jgi:uncharacterized protein YnzC (UPF0291/DUF896 family)
MKQSRYKELSMSLWKNQWDIINSLTEIYEGLDEMIQYPGKGFYVEWGKFKFDFHPASTPEEENEQRKARRKLLKMMLKDTFRLMINTLGSIDDKEEIDVKRNKLWSIFNPFIVGTDPHDMECEKIKLEDIYEVGDSEHGKSRPLDESSYQVQVALDRNILNKEVESDVKEIKEMVTKFYNIAS